MRKKTNDRFLSSVRACLIRLLCLVVAISGSLNAFSSTLSSSVSIPFHSWLIHSFNTNLYFYRKSPFVPKYKYIFFVKSMKNIPMVYKRKYRFLVPRKTFDSAFFQWGNAYYFVASYSSRFDYRNYLQSPHFLSGFKKRARDIVSNALNLIGIRYIWGGNSPERGLDCSGFVKYVVDNTLGSNLPRMAIQMSRLGQKIKKGDLQPGDLVFFNTRHRPYSHVGIYISSNMFAHAPSTGNKIRVDNLKNRYWSSRYNGARRLDCVTIGD